MSNLIPISELPTEREGLISEIPEPRVVWGVELPGHLDQDRILFDADHLQRLQKLSGSVLTTIAVDPDAKGEEYDASIQGINMDGTAIMGRVKKVSPADPSTKNVMYEFNSPKVHNSYGAFADAHLLNKAAMVDEVVAMRSRKTISSEDAWGRVLDDHIQRSIRQTSKDVMVGAAGVPNFAQKWEYGWLTFVAGWSVFDMAVGNYVGAGIQTSILAANYGLGLLRDTMINKAITGDSLIEKRRWSLFTESQADRYLALNALTRVSSIIKVRK